MGKIPDRTFFNWFRKIMGDQGSAVKIFLNGLTGQ